MHGWKPPVDRHATIITPQALRNTRGLERLHARLPMPGSQQAEAARRETNRLLSSRVSSESAVTLRLREGAIEVPHRNARVVGVQLK